jgi:hypothetical protein
MNEVTNMNNPTTGNATPESAARDLDKIAHRNARDAPRRKTIDIRNTFVLLTGDGLIGHQMTQHFAYLDSRFDGQNVQWQRIHNTLANRAAIRALLRDMEKEAQR